MKEYIKRVVDDELDELMSSLPAVALEGPKGVGKTETAGRLAHTSYRLDDPAVLEIAKSDPERLLLEPSPILLDEWQLLPELWDGVRRAVDGGAKSGSFILTGSASPINRPTHSGAGRIVSVRMRPLSILERNLCPTSVSLHHLLEGEGKSLQGKCPLKLSDYVDEILGSGFPAIRTKKGRALRALLDGYIRRVVDVDIADQGIKLRHPSTLLSWMKAYAAATATSTSYETLRDAATSRQADKPSKTTTIPYREALERLWILEPLPAWLPRNHLSRLIRAPKHHLVDPALAARLIGANAKTLLSGESIGPTVPRDGSLLGHLFESLVTQSIRVYAQQLEAKVFHLRTAGNKQEVDLIIERMDGKVLAIEVKLSKTIDDRDVRHLHWLKEKIGDDLLDAIVITTGHEAYRRKDGIGVVPLGLLGV